MANVVDIRSGGEPPTAPASPFNWLDWKAVAVDPLPPMSWACEALQIGPGRPCGIWGYGGSGKSWVAQALALSVASGQKFLGKFDVKRGKVAHISHELGRRAVGSRYRRLANGMMVDFEDVQDWFKLSVFPKLYLNSPKAEDWYKRELEGVSLCVVDSLRRALPGADENDSKISNHLDILSRISDKLGVTFEVIHHSGKSVVNRTDDKRHTGPKDERGAGRGSSAIEDASGSIWKVEGHGTGPRKLVMARNHEEAEDPVPPVWITMPPISRPDPIYDMAESQAVRVVCLEESEVHSIELAAKRKGNIEQWRRDCREIYSVVQANSSVSLRKLLRELGDRRALREAAEDMVEGDVLEESSGPKRSRQFTIGPADIELFLDPKAVLNTDGWFPESEDD